MGDFQTGFVNSFHDKAACVGEPGSGKTFAATMRVAQMVLGWKPRIRDTPFWIVGRDYEQVIRSCWNDKLFGLGFIPDTEIDWPRVEWYDKRREMPLKVPLLCRTRSQPDPGSWCIEFHHVASNFPRVDIAGFLATEIPEYTSAIAEVIRRMREWLSLGTMLFEYTPLDGNNLPFPCVIYPLNVQCNIADPKSPVTQEWYDELRGARKT